MTGAQRACRQNALDQVRNKPNTEAHISDSVQSPRTLQEAKKDEEEKARRDRIMAKRAAQGTTKVCHHIVLYL